MGKILFLLSASLAAASLPAQAPTMSGSPTGTQLENLLPKLMREASIPGLSAALLQDGKVVWSGAFGVKNERTREPVTSETVFEAASLSKPVFAATVMQLVARGELNLDEPLWKTFPDPRLGHDPRSREITARMALSHTTGLPNWGGTPLELKFDPGSQWSYSGEGYVYLQKVVEELTGTDLDSLVRKEIFKVAGMSSSGYLWRDEYESSMASGHSWLSEPRDFRRADKANAAASLYTTASDYARFLAALLSRHSFAAETLARMSEPVVQVSGDDSPKAAKHLWWGLGWGLKEGRHGRALWHWGDNQIFRCFVLFYPERGAGLVYFTNSENGLAIADAIESLFDDEPWAARWLDYPSANDPRRKARRSMVETFLQRDFGAGMARLESLAAESAPWMDESLLNRIGYDLLERESYAPAREVFRKNTLLHPNSAKALDSLAEAQLKSDQIGPALESLTRAASIEPSDSTIRKRLDWVRDLARCHGDEKPTATQDLRCFEGCYGSRTVVLRDDRLYFQREGNEYPLIPAGGARFALEGLNTFRIRFLSDEEGHPIALEGEYFDGRVDQLQARRVKGDEQNRVETPF